LSLTTLRYADGTNYAHETVISRIDDIARQDMRISYMDSGLVSVSSRLHPIRDDLTNRITGMFGGDPDLLARIFSSMSGHANETDELFNEIVRRYQSKDNREEIIELVAAIRTRMHTAHEARKLSQLLGSAYPSFQELSDMLAYLEQFPASPDD